MHQDARWRIALWMPDPDQNRYVDYKAVDTRSDAKNERTMAQAISIADTWYQTNRPTPPTGSAEMITLTVDEVYPLDPTRAAWSNTTRDQKDGDTLQEYYRVYTRGAEYLTDGWVMEDA